MADEASSTSSPGSGEGREAPGTTAEPASIAASPHAPSLTATRPIDLIEKANRLLKSATGRPIDSVCGFRKSDEGWHLTVTVVELSRIPAASDVLADYEVSLDEAGNIVDYRRGRRFLRAQVGDQE